MDINEARQRIKKTISQNLLSLDLSSSFDTVKLTQTDLINLLPELVKLTKLKNLSLEGNEITQLPIEITKLENLRTLSLAGNNISEIPKEINRLSNLNALYFQHNKIRFIPKEIIQLQNLEYLDLNNNQITEIPKEITQSLNPQKIFNFLLALEKSITRPINEAKIMVVGEANVGKTSLINRLLYNKHNQYLTDTTSTHGISIHNWIVKIDNEIVQLNFWDFGGQQIMHSTHQLFFTARTIYILVLNARQNEDNNKTNEWLKKIEVLGGNSPIIIVGNKIDENVRNTSSTDIGYFDINRSELATKYRNIKGFYGVSCRVSNKSYDELFNSFRKGLLEEVRKLEGIHKPFPSKWYAIKQKLAQLKENVPYISYSDYIKLCLEQDVEDGLSQETLIEFLNEIGTVIYFKDLPKTIILYPEWLTKAVYSIVDNATVFKNKGVFEMTQVASFLNLDEYPLDKHKFIVDLMQKFEICVAIESSKKFLIPDLLPDDEMYTGDWDNAVRFEFHYEVYLSSVFTRFVIRTFPFIFKNTYWRSGVVLEYEGIKALVKADRRERKIIIQVAGESAIKRRSFLSLIRNEFNQIHNKFSSLKVNEFIAYPTIPEILVDYDELIYLKESGENEIFVKELRRKLPISDLLKGIETKEEPKPTEIAEDFIEKFEIEVRDIKSEKGKNRLSNDEFDKAIKEAAADFVLNEIRETLKETFRGTFISNKK